MRWTLCVFTSFVMLIAGVLFNGAYAFDLECKRPLMPSDKEIGTFMTEHLFDLDTSMDPYIWNEAKRVIEEASVFACFSTQKRKQKKWIGENGLLALLKKEWNTYASVGVMIPEAFMAIPIEESGLRTFIRAPTGETGLWQLKSSLARSMGLHILPNCSFPKSKEAIAYCSHPVRDERTDPVKSTKAALKYFVKLYQSYCNNWVLAFSAYASGESNVAAFINKNGGEISCELNPKISKGKKEVLGRVLGYLMVYGLED